jgi:hypothetical protein
LKVSAVVPQLAPVYTIVLNENKTRLITVESIRNEMIQTELRGAMGNHLATFIEKFSLTEANARKKTVKAPNAVPKAVPAAVPKTPAAPKAVPLAVPAVPVPAVPLAVPAAPPLPKPKVKVRKPVPAAPVPVPAAPAPAPAPVPVPVPAVPSAPVIKMLPKKVKDLKIKVKDLKV